MTWLVQLDGDILLFIQQYLRNDFLTPIFKFITSLGNYGWFWIVLSLMLLVPRKTRWIGITALIALIIGTLITNVILKNMVARIRPYEVVDGLVLLVEKQKDFSFPSGHSCASFAAAMVYYRMLPRRWGIPAVVLAALISFSRLYVGVHYPTDVLAGIMIGCFAAWAACKIRDTFLVKMHNKKEKNVVKM